MPRRADLTMIVPTFTNVLEELTRARSIASATPAGAIDGLHR
jgi:hypothetical protein